MKIKICHLYQELLNLYGDNGNIIAMQKRLEWRNISYEIDYISLNDKFDSNKYDIVFIGGGQDFEQEVILNDLKGDKSKEIIQAIENNVTFLAICGGLQLLGNYYKTWDNHEFEFIGALDLYTVGSKKRMIGDYIFSCEDINNEYIVGFENHSGKTYLGNKVRALGIIKKGYGNNGEDKKEGARYKNTFCTYSHGPLLPKNYKLCDKILDTAIYNKYNIHINELENNNYEVQAMKFIKNRLL